MRIQLLFELASASNHDANANLNLVFSFTFGDRRIVWVKGIHG